MRYLPFLLVLVLTACVHDGTGDSRQGLSNFLSERADNLRRAEALASRSNDPYAAECWAALAERAEALGADITDPKATGLSPAVAYQHARNVRRGIEGRGPWEKIRARCAHMRDDLRRAVAGLIL